MGCHVLSLDRSGFVVITVPTLRKMCQVETRLKYQRLTGRGGPTNINNDHHGVVDDDKMVVLIIRRVIVTLEGK